MTRSTTLAALLTFASGVALAQDAANTLTLTSGETMSVTVLERTAESITVQHPLLGELTIPADGVASLDGAPYEIPVEQIAAQPEEEELAGTTPVWTSSLELGINGSEGNSENLSGRVAFRTERLVEDVERFEFLSRYRIDTRDGDRTTNEWYNSALQEWFLPDHPRWSWFVLGTAEYDEFQDWDVRVSGTVGLGYKFIDREDLKFRGRVGLGASYEFGAEDEELVPEALIGYDYENQLNERSRITSTGNLFPSLSNGGEFRSYVDLAYELDVTDDGAWALRLGAEHQYDSDTDSETPWDFAYFASLVTTF